MRYTNGCYVKIVPLIIRSKVRICFSRIITPSFKLLGRYLGTLDIIRSFRFMEKLRSRSVNAFSAAVTCSTRYISPIIWLDIVPSSNKDILIKIHLLLDWTWKIHPIWSASVPFPFKFSPVHRNRKPDLQIYINAGCKVLVWTWPTGITTEAKAPTGWHFDPVSLWVATITASTRKRVAIFENRVIFWSLSPSTISAWLTPYGTFHRLRKNRSITSVSAYP